MSHELPNSDKIIEDPRFVCEERGYANVRLFTVANRSAAKCTNCGCGYLGGESA